MSRDERIKKMANEVDAARRQSLRRKIKELLVNDKSGSVSVLIKKIYADID